jgi:hypothetical protein
VLHLTHDNTLYAVAIEPADRAPRYVAVFECDPIDASHANLPDLVGWWSPAARALVGTEGWPRTHERERDRLADAVSEHLRERL